VQAEPDDTAMFLHRHDQRLALDEVEADVEIVRDTALEVAVHVHLFHVLDLVPQPVAQRADAAVFLGHLELCQARRLAEADDLVRRQRAGAKAALVPPPWICASMRTRGFRRM